MNIPVRWWISYSTRLFPGFLQLLVPLESEDIPFKIRDVPVSLAFHGYKNDSRTRFFYQAFKISKIRFCDTGRTVVIEILLSIPLIGLLTVIR